MAHDVRRYRKEKTMTVLKSIALAIIGPGSLIWVPCVIGAACWAVRYFRRRRKEMARTVRRYREEVVYE